jgi:hypothetical protein
MGFNKRFLDKERIMESLGNKEPLSKLFSADAFIFMDDFSSKVYNHFKKGAKDKEIKKIIDNDELK